MDDVDLEPVDSRFKGRFSNSSPLFLSSRKSAASLPAVMRYVTAPLRPESKSMACTASSAPLTAPCPIAFFKVAEVAVVAVVDERALAVIVEPVALAKAL